MHTKWLSYTQYVLSLIFPYERHTFNQLRFAQSTKCPRGLPAHGTSVCLSLHTDIIDCQSNNNPMRGILNPCDLPFRIRFNICIRLKLRNNPLLLNSCSLMLAPRDGLFRSGRKGEKSARSKNYFL